MGASLRFVHNFPPKKLSKIALTRTNVQTKSAARPSKKWQVVAGSRYRPKMWGPEEEYRSSPVC